MDQLIKYLLFVCVLFQVKPGLQPRAAHFQAAKPVKPVKQALLLPAKLKVLDITDFWDYVVSCFKFLPLYFLINEFPIQMPLIGSSSSYKHFLH